jgi:TATA-box binding protein (TBP) (component of TFIID and TFIIIB)
MPLSQASTFGLDDLFGAGTVASSSSGYGQSHVAVESMDDFFGDMDCSSGPSVREAPLLKWQDDSAADPDGDEILERLRTVAPLPDPTKSLPSGLKLKVFLRICCFNTGCAVNLKRLAFSLRHAEYTPCRLHTLIIRQRDPTASVQVCSTGKCRVLGKLSEDEARSCARKAARAIQKCGHPAVKFSSYRIVCTKFASHFRFPVRLERLAQNWPNNTLYEPDVSNRLIFRVPDPPVTFSVTSTGKFHAHSSGGDTQRALEIFHSLCHDCQI